MNALRAAAWGAIAYNAYFYWAYRPRSVKGDVVLITGGASGIGRRMALMLAEQGASIVLWDLAPEPLEKVKREVEAKGVACRTFVVDISNRELVYSTAKEVGRVDILVNNAGIVSGKKILDCPDGLMTKTMDVNATAHFWTIKAFLPAMMERNSGHIVTIASAAGLAGLSGLVDYCASKFAAVGLTQSLQFELRRLKMTGVRTTLVCPYFINTGMFDGVKTFWPLLFPILEEEWASARIIKAILRGEEWLCMPWMITLTPVLQGLPAPIGLAIAELFRMNETMDSFRGRQH